MAYDILVVDDSTSIRAIIKKIIKLSGFDVGRFWEAPDGLKALSVLQTQHVDLMLTDINMPNMDGMELISCMKDTERLADIPIVVVSTEGSEKKMKKALDMGAAGYVKKPFVPEEIKRTLNTILGVGDGPAVLDSDDGEIDF